LSRTLSELFSLASWATYQFLIAVGIQLIVDAVAKRTQARRSRDFPRFSKITKHYVFLVVKVSFPVRQFVLQWPHPSTLRFLSLEKSLFKPNRRKNTSNTAENLFKDRSKNQGFISETSFDQVS